MALPDRVRLVVLFGGRSAEHEVSCSTASHVLRTLDPSRYDTVPIGITRAGVWTRNDDAIAALRGDGRSLPESLQVTGTEVEAIPSLAPAVGDDARIVVLPLLHGPHGEDGTIQGLLELADVPYVGAGVLGSAAAMDKIAAKRLAEANGLPQARWRGFRDADLDETLLDDIAVDLGLPCFVKPANMGSSIGVSKAATRAELGEAVDVALGYDEFVVVEEALDAREIEVAVLGNAHPRASVPGEIRPGDDFYTYADKYVDGVSEGIIPAPISDEQTDEVRRLAVRAFGALRADGMARCDFFFEEDGRGFLLNEVNTIPGFTPISMFPKLWAASGIPYGKLIDELVALALERHDRRSRFRTDHEGAPQE